MNLVHGGGGRSGTRRPAWRPAPAARRAARPPALRGLRGWGGVAAMAVACGLALSAVAVPLAARPGPPGPGSSLRRSAASAADTAARGRQVLAEGTCAHPEASLRPSSAAGPAVQRIQRRGYLTVGVDQDSYLWGYLDPASGHIVGFDIDLVRAIAADLLGPNARIVFRTVPTDQRIAALQRHEVDMVVRTMTINCERAAQVAFSTSYFEAGQQLLVPRTGTAITGFDASLRGRTVCTASGSTGQALLESRPHGERVVLVPNQLDCLVRLQLGQVDAVLTDNALAAGQAAQDPSVHVIGQPLTHEPYGVAMNLDDTDLVRRVNKVLEDYRGGGAASQWMRAYNTWLAHDLPGISGPPAPLYRD